MKLIKTGKTIQCGDEVVVDGGRGGVPGYIESVVFMPDKEPRGPVFNDMGDLVRRPEPGELGKIVVTIVREM